MKTKAAAKAHQNDIDEGGNIRHRRKSGMRHGAANLAEKAASGGGIGGVKQSAAGGGAASVKPAMAALAAAGRRMKQTAAASMAFNGGEMAQWRK
jgi:hypothetical protein